MNTALKQPVPFPRQPGQPGFTALRLDDFSSRGAGGQGLPDPEALLRAHAEGQAEGAAMAHDRQMEALTRALCDQAEALAQYTATRDRLSREVRAEIAQLLRAVTTALLPMGRDARLVEGLVAALGGIDADAAPRARIACPEHLHDDIRAACRNAGLAAPTLTAAPEAALHLDDAVSRMDMTAMQERLLRLIDEYATGEP